MIGCSVVLEQYDWLSPRILCVKNISCDVTRDECCLKENQPGMKSVYETTLTFG